MYIDYKVKKYNFKIIESIKNNDVKKIPEYLNHLYFYLKKNINNNLIGGKPGPNNYDLDSDAITKQLDSSLEKLKSYKLELLKKLDSKDKDRNNEICKNKEDIMNKIRDCEVEKQNLKKENQEQINKIKDLEAQIEALKTSNSSSSQEVQEKITQLQKTIEDNNKIIEENKVKIKGLEEEKSKLEKELSDYLEILKATQDRRQSNFSSALLAIKKFRLLTEELSSFPEMESSNLMHVFGFTGTEELKQNWGLDDAAATFILNKDVSAQVPKLELLKMEKAASVPSASAASVPSASAASVPSASTASVPNVSAAASVPNVAEVSS